MGRKRELKVRDSDLLLSLLTPSLGGFSLFCALSLAHRLEIHPNKFIRPLRIQNIIHLIAGKKCPLRVLKEEREGASTSRLNSVDPSRF